MVQDLAERVIDFLFGLTGPTVYVLVGILSWAEAAFFLGFVTPGELAIGAAGALASRGQVTLYGVVAAAMVGTALGNTTGYWLGRVCGTRVLGWRPLLRVLGPTVERTREFMTARGEWAIVVGRFATFTRVVVPFLAGASKLSYRRYMLFDLPTTLVWAVTWATLGFALGESWRALLDHAGAAAFLVLILAVTAYMIRWIAVRLARNQRRVLAGWRIFLWAVGLERLASRLDPALRWVGRRLDPRVVSGLSLTLGFMVLVGAASTAGLVLQQTRTVWGLALLDFPALEWMAATRTDEAVQIARSGLEAFHWPGMMGVAVPAALLLGWRVGPATGLRAALGILGAGLGALFLERLVLEGVVPRAEFPSVPVAVAAALLVHAAAGTGARRGWGGGVTAAALGTFLTCTVALGTLVAGWAAPSGIAMGFTLGLGWAAILEFQGRLLRAEALPTEPDEPPKGGGMGEASSTPPAHTEPPPRLRSGRSEVASDAPPPSGAGSSRNSAVEGR